MIKETDVQRGIREIVQIYYDLDMSEEDCMMQFIQELHEETDYLIDFIYEELEGKVTK